MQKIELIKRYVSKGMTPKEIASKTDMNIGSVYNYMYRLRKDEAQSKEEVAETLHRVSRGRERMKHQANLTEIRDGQVHLVKELTDTVNHPPHYKTGGIETIDFIEAKSLNYHLGNVVKYIKIGRAHV